MAVRTRSAAQTAKNWVRPWWRCCSATRAAMACWKASMVRLLENLGRHQIDQRENKHPNEIDEMPVQAGDFDIGGVIDLWFQPQNDRAYDSGNQQDVSAVMKGTGNRCAEPGSEPEDQEDGNEGAPQGY